MHLLQTPLRTCHRVLQSSLRSRILESKTILLTLLLTKRSLFLKTNLYFGAQVGCIMELAVIETLDQLGMTGFVQYNIQSFDDNRWLIWLHNVNVPKSLLEIEIYINEYDETVGSVLQRDRIGRSAMVAIMDTLMANIDDDESDDETTLTISSQEALAQ